MGKRETSLDLKLDAKARPLIENYKKRAQDKHYASRVRSLVMALSEAEKSTTEAAKRLALCGLDHEHVSDINLALAPNSDKHDPLIDIETDLQELSYSCKYLAMVLKSVTGIKAAKNRGRPSLNYTSETRSLMQIYEEVTEKRVVFPKGADASGAAYQHSTEFIRRALSEIDPKIKTSSAITCIRNTLKENAKLREVIDNLMQSKKACQSANNKR